MSRHWTPYQVRYIFKRDDGMCIYCGALAIEIDHVIPFKEGGKSIVSNGVCICKRCNDKKKANMEIDMLTRAIFWLLEHGEDVSWMDSHYNT